MSNFIFLLSMLFLANVVFAFATQNNEADVLKAFKKYDLDHDELLSSEELESYFYKHYMKAFEGIEIDPKFITATLKQIRSHDLEGDGISPEELVNAVAKKEKTEPKDRQPHYYPEQEL